MYTDELICLVVTKFADLKRTNKICEMIEKLHKDYKISPSVDSVRRALRDYEEWDVVIELMESFDEEAHVSH